MTDIYCATCRRAVTRIDKYDGINLVHSYEYQGRGKADHDVEPIPLPQLSNPYIECDFCSREEATWTYVAADQTTDSRRVVQQTVGLRDYQQRHSAARVLSTKTTHDKIHNWGDRWAACDGCAELIENRDLLGLVRRIIDVLPPKVTRGRKLLEVRGSLIDLYTNIFATLRPGRGRIIPENPLGEWETNEQSN